MDAINIQFAEAVDCFVADGGGCETHFVGIAVSIWLENPADRLSCAER